MIFNNQTNDLLDSIASITFIPLILQPTRTSHSDTLKDNIFSNVIDPDITLSNLSAKISSASIYNNSEYVCQYLKQ